MYPDLEVMIIYTTYHVFKELPHDCRNIYIYIMTIIVMIIISDLQDTRLLKRKTRLNYRFLLSQNYLMQVVN